MGRETAVLSDSMELSKDEVAAGELNFPQPFQLFRIADFHPETISNSDGTSVSGKYLCGARPTWPYRAVVIVGGFDVGDAADAGSWMAHPVANLQLFEFVFGHLQYSFGSNVVVTLRSASVIIQMHSVSLAWTGTS